MNIRLAELSDKTAWDAFVVAHKEASIYHRYAWREAVEKAYGHRGHYLIAEEGGEIVGVLPLIFMRCPLLYRKVVSLPYCDVGGILADHENVGQRLSDEAVAVAGRLGVKSIEIRCRAKSGFVPGTGLNFSARTDKASMVLSLPESSTILWDGFKSKLRSQVRKAEKNNLAFTWGEEKDRGDFYAVFFKNMWELGSPVHSREWIDAILDKFGEQARMGLIYYKAKPVGAGIILFQGRKVSIPWASTLREYNHLSPNMLLYWKLLQFSADSGFEQFDFGRSTIGEGTYKFKSQWGAEPQPLYWYTAHVGSHDVKKETNISRFYGKREHLATLWARLPFWVVNFLGPHIRRHISL